MIYESINVKGPDTPPPKVPPISMAGGLAAGLASELKTDAIPYGRRFSAAFGGKLQYSLTNHTQCDSLSPHCDRPIKIFKRPV